MGGQGKNQRLADVFGGILVLGALPGSPAAKLGLHYGDVLMSVNGQRTSTVEDFLAARGLNTKLMRLEVVRGGQTVRIELDISKRSAKQSLEQVADHLARGGGATDDPSGLPS